MGLRQHRENIKRRRNNTVEGGDLMKWLIGAILVVILAIWLLVKVVEFSLATIGGLLGILVALVAGAIVLSLILYLFRLVRSKQ